MNRCLKLFVTAVSALLLVASCGGDGDSASGGKPDTGAPAVIVIGADGAEWQVINDLVEQGELPGFARMMEEGAHGHLLNPGPQVSPVVWTTFATGHFSRDHGILDFVHPFTDTEGKQPVDVSLRRKPALWNLLDAHDKRSTVIGYFVSYPAEPVAGRIVSDRAFQGLEQSVWPEAIESLSDEIRRSVRDDREALYARFLPWPYEKAQAEDESSPYHEAARLVERNVDNRIVSDEYLKRMTEALIDEPADLLISYYRIIDIASHALWYYYDASDWDEKPSEEQMELLGDVVQESYRYVDEVIQLMLERFGDEANIFVISDHGFGSAIGQYAPRANPLLTGNHRPNGVILAHGPDITPGELEPTTIMEVFPTLAGLLGVPIADTLPGGIEYDLLREEALDEQPPQYTERYDFGWRVVEGREVDAEAQAEEMESLRGLGYIGEGVTLGDAADGEYDFWSVEANLLVANLHGEVVYYLLRGDESAADAVANSLKRNAPHLLPLLLARTRAKVHSLRRDVPGADDLAPETEAFVKRHQGSTQ